ncbi:MAG: anaerobic sulfatase maturase [Christensenellales bacterium]|jgi:uncharacterized protein
MKTLTIMLKPASSLCNLSCRYCFYHDLADARAVKSYGIMKPDVLEAVVRRAAQEVESAVQFVFQGGEPLLAGLDFFRAFESLVETYIPKSLRVDRSIQTNGALIDAQWASFFAQHGYLVGVSLDGPAALHNDLRIFPDGKGSFSRVMAGIRALDRAHVPYNILTVVSEPIARRGAAVYNFLRKSGWDYLQFIPCLNPVTGDCGAHALRSESYGRFLINIFDLYADERARGKQVSVRWFDNVLDMLAGRPPESCGMSGVCACHIVVESDGGVYPCDFYVHDSHRLGSLLDQSLASLLASDAAAQFIEESRALPAQCEVCPHRSLCRNGCRRYRQPYLSGAPGANELCEGYRMFFDHIARRMG